MKKEAGLFGMQKIGKTCGIVTAFLCAFMMSLFLHPVEARAEVNYTKNATPYGEWAGVYTAVAEPREVNGTIGISSIAKQNLTAEPTTQKPAIIMGAASPFEKKIGPVEFQTIREGATTTAPYKYFRYTITEERNPNGAGGSHKKMSGFDGTYYIIRVDISRFFEGDTTGKYLHVKQKGNKALMVVPFEPQAFKGGTTFASSGTQVGSFSLADKNAFLDDGTDTPYLDVIVYSSGTLVSGADTGGSSASQFTADFPFTMYVDETEDYLPDVTFDAAAASPDTAKWPTYGDYFMTKYYKDDITGAENSYTSYTIKGGDIEIEVMNDARTGKEEFWSLHNAMGSALYSNGSPIKLICEVPVLEGIVVNGGKNIVLDVYSFDIQIANHQTTSAAALTVENGTLTIQDSFNTTGAELAVGNNARMEIGSGGTFIIADTCQLEVEYDAASTPAGETPTTYNNGLITVHNGGRIINKGIVTIEGTEGKPIDPQAPVTRDMKAAVLRIEQGGIFTNEGALLINGALYNMGTIENSGRYTDVIKSSDPDKGSYTYHKGIQVSWKDDVTQNDVSIGHLTNGIESDDEGAAKNTGAKVVNTGDIVLTPGKLENYGIVENAAGGNIYLCPVSEAIVPVQLNYDPLTTEKRIKIGITIPGEIFNYDGATFTNAGKIASGNVELVNNGRTGTITPAILDDTLVFNKGTFNNNGSISSGKVYNYNEMTNTGTIEKNVAIRADEDGHQGRLVDSAAQKLTNVYGATKQVQGNSNVWTYAPCKSLSVVPVFQNGTGGQIVGWQVMALSDSKSSDLKYLVYVTQSTDGKTVKTFEAPANRVIEVSVDSLPKVNGNVNYQFSLEDYSATANTTVKIASDTKVVPTSIKGLVYNGKEQTLVTSGNSDIGTMEFKVGAGGAWSTSVPTAKNAGVYQVYYRFASTGEESGPIEVTIAKRPLTVSADDLSSKVGNPLRQCTYTVSGLVANDALDGVTITATTDANKDAAGAYTITINATGESTNYNLEKVNNGKYTVTTVDFEVTATDVYGVFSDDLTYKGFNIKVTAPAGSTVYYSDTTELNSSNYTTYGVTALKNNPTTAGTHDIYYYVVKNDDKNVAVSGVKRVIISKAEQNPPDKTKITTTPATYKNSWDGMIQGLTARATEYRRIDNDGTYTMVYFDVAFVTPGTYLVRFAEDENHYASPDIIVVVQDGPPINVTFVSGVGYFYEEKNLSYGDKLTKPTDPKYEGAKFLGWYYNGELFDFSQPVTQSMLLEAKWEGTVPGIAAKVEVSDLTDDKIEQGIKDAGYTTTAQIRTALEEALVLKTDEQKQNTALYDVRIKIKDETAAGGWRDATAADIEKFGPIVVVLDYPNGTNGYEYIFKIAHMIGNTTGSAIAGTIETPGYVPTEFGIRTAFKGVSPVMISWTKRSEQPSPTPTPGTNKTPTVAGESREACDHNYIWETRNEATDDSDGEMVYKCTKCGDIQYSVPVSAYFVFNKKVHDSIKNADKNATVRVDTSLWISFHRMVMEAMAERPDVSVEVHYLSEGHKGSRKTFTIPKGTDTVSLLDKNGYAGFIFLDGKFK